jgi:hypothetical protein
MTSFGLGIIIVALETQCAFTLVSSLTYYDTIVKSAGQLSQNSFSMRLILDTGP